MKPEKYPLGEYVWGKVSSVTSIIGEMGASCFGWVRRVIFHHWWCHTCNKYHSNRVKRYAKYSFLPLDVCSLGITKKEQNSSMDRS